MISPKWPDNFFSTLPIWNRYYLSFNLAYDSALCSWYFCRNNSTLLCALISEWSSCSVTKKVVNMSNYFWSWQMLRRMDKKRVWKCTYDEFSYLDFKPFLWLMVLFLREPDKCMLPNPLLVILSTRIKLKSKRDILYFFFLPWTDMVCEIRSS